MSNSEKTNFNISFNSYSVNKYLITYRENITAELFSCDQYYGIAFFMEDGRYDVLYNKDMGHRITINLKNGSWKGRNDELRTSEVFK